MSHIASCVVNADQASLRHSPSQPSTPDKPHAWRMLPSDQHHRYQLFPKDKQLPASVNGKALDPEKAYAYAMGDKADKASAAAHLRLRPGQPRRRKTAAQDPFHMTTVHELPMDSRTSCPRLAGPAAPPLTKGAATIPGRPALHERSSSAPKEKTGPPPAPAASKHRFRHDFSLDGAATDAEDSALSPSDLPPLDGPAPLAIPQRGNRPAPLLQSRMSVAMLRSDSAPPRESPRPALEASPLARELYTPSASTPDLSLPRSATTDGTSATSLTTPTSAPFTEPHCASPKSWDGPGISEGFTTPCGDRASTYGTVCGHQRRVSESSSIMERGRPRKRTVPPGSNVCRDRDGSGPLPAPSKCNECARDTSLERRAFDDLPRGWKPRDALRKLSADDSASLQKQAYRQAERFEVLGAGHVEALSKELRQLDERTEYLRGIYSSLRVGRRNLHSRICQYLRSPRTTRFSHESMLRQEEALAELDDSIDGWVNKLEHVENRRARIRQKLLEHVAAAALLPVPSSPAPSREALQRDMGARPSVPSGISTPPRSPTRRAFSSAPGGENPSPARVVAQAPSAIVEQPVVEPEQATQQTGKGPKRADVESIRVYVGGGDVLALLADVEDEISWMSSQNSQNSQNSQRLSADPSGSTGREMNGSSPRHPKTSPRGLAPSFVFPPRRTTSSNISTSQGGFEEMMSTLPPPPPLKDTKPTESEILLTSDVFKP